MRLQRVKKIANQPSAQCPLASADLLTSYADPWVKGHFLRSTIAGPSTGQTCLHGYIAAPGDSGSHGNDP
ncbi:uncharacterized [Tachysurus ichikawai]